jgi:hypothetical protein
MAESRLKDRNHDLEFHGAWLSLLIEAALADPVCFTYTLDLAPEIYYNCGARLSIRF